MGNGDGEIPGFFRGYLEPDSGNMYPSSWRFFADGNGESSQDHAAGAGRWYVMS